MKLLYSIFFLISTNILLAQDTLNNNFPNYFIATIELRYELVKIKRGGIFPNHYKSFPSLELHQTIKPFSLDELPPYFDLELSEEDIFEFQSGFKIEGMDYFWLAKNNHKKPTSKNQYSKTALIYTTNFDEKESVNFYQQLIKKNTLNGNNYLAFSNIIYQRQKFLRSFLEWNLKFGKRSFHINIAHTNNLEYQDLDLTSIGYGDQNFVYFPEAYHEKRNGEWGYLFETQHLFLSEINVFTKVLFNPLKKTYLKFDYDLRYFFFQSNKRERQRFHALGIGVKPKEGTLLFLEYTNQTVFFDRIPLQNKFPSDAYFALNAKQILKFRLFKK